MLLGNRFSGLCLNRSRGKDILSGVNVPSTNGLSCVSWIWMGWGAPILCVSFLRLALSLRTIHISKIKDHFISSIVLSYSSIRSCLSEYVMFGIPSKSICYWRLHLAWNFFNVDTSRGNSTRSPSLTLRNASQLFRTWGSPSVNSIPIKQTIPSPQLFTFHTYCPLPSFFLSHMPPSPSPVYLS